MLAHEAVQVESEGDATSRILKTGASALPDGTGLCNVGFTSTDIEWRREPLADASCPPVARGRSGRRRACGGNAIELD